MAWPVPYMPGQARITAVVAMAPTYNEIAAWRKAQAAAGLLDGSVQILWCRTVNDLHTRAHTHRTLYNLYPASQMGEQQDQMVVYWLNQGNNIKGPASRRWSRVIEWFLDQMQPYIGRRHSSSRG